jgi:hypothetical protein
MGFKTDSIIRLEVRQNPTNTATFNPDRNMKNTVHSLVHNCHDLYVTIG